MADSAPVRAFVRVARLVSVLSLAMLPGCLSTTVYETARVCPWGTGEVTVAATPWLWRRDSTRFHQKDWYEVGPELSSRVGLFKNFDVGLRWLAAPGACLTTKYQVLHGPVDIAFTAAGYGFGFAAIDAAGQWLGAYGGLLASREHPFWPPFSAQALLRYDYTDGGGTFGGWHKSGLVTASLGLGIPLRLGQYRVHPAFSCSLPLSWQYWDWEYYPHYDPPPPPRQEDEYRGRATFDLGIGISYITAR